MTIGNIITYIMLFFALIGAADRAIGCRFGPGKAFVRGFESTGALILTMIGPITLAPLIAKYLAPLVTPFFGMLGIDPSVIAGIFLANDAGGWQLAMALAQDEQIGKLAGSVIGSTMGCTLISTFPLCFAIIPREKHLLAAKGIIVGMISLPVTYLVSGLLFGISLPALLRNLLPLLLFAGIFIIGLIFFERLTIRCVTVFGYILTGILTAALAVAMVIKVAGFQVADLGSFDEGMLIIGGIAIFLCGAFTLLFFLEKLCRGIFVRAGSRLGINETSVMGIVTSSVNGIPVFAMAKDMNDRGIVLNLAFMIPASFMIGDHLAFQAAVDTSTILPLVLGKLAGGIGAVALAMVFTRKTDNGA